MAGKGRLSEAGRLIQQALMEFAGYKTSAGPQRTSARRAAASTATQPLAAQLVPQDLLKAEVKVQAAADRLEVPPEAVSDAPPEIIVNKRPDQLSDTPPGTAPAMPAPSASSFDEGLIEYGGHSYPYRLYVPARPVIKPGPMPLLVLLHGCQQDALDFASGTAMNALADEHGCMVLYPQQITRANSGRCWNWFEPGHQQRELGEPGMIAALTQQVLEAAHNGAQADPARVYIAGLSAGGAMAALVADLYPDVFVAVGVHSGLPAGAAQSMMSAFNAMQRGSKGQAAAALPTIVFHGTADKTVHPDNGENVSDAALAALKGTGLALVKSPKRGGSSSIDKTVYRIASGPSYIEHWRIEEGPHAWSGGNAAGSFTDPAGPSASAAMLAFFLQHSKAQPAFD